MTDLPCNLSARYRAARLELFRTVVAREQLTGVILAHHADDQAETVLHRLIRGSGPAGLAGMSTRTCIAGLTVLRPLLPVRRGQLREFLHRIGQPWREDASNASDDYLRNRLRRWLSDKPELHEALIALADACRALRDWTNARAPELPETFAANQLGALPDLLACESARRWLVARGAPPDVLTEDVLDRLIDMARDAGTAPRVDFPGGLHVRRRGGMISVAHSMVSRDAKRSDSSDQAKCAAPRRG
jgi:tRNA(Ile)-lysidine synthase